MRLNSTVYSVHLSIKHRVAVGSTVNDIATEESYEDAISDVSCITVSRPNYKERAQTSKYSKCTSNLCGYYDSINDAKRRRTWNARTSHGKKHVVTVGITGRVLQTCQAPDVLFNAVDRPKRARGSFTTIVDIEDIIRVYLVMIEHSMHTSTAPNVSVRSAKDSWWSGQDYSHSPVGHSRL